MTLQLNLYGENKKAAIDKGAIWDGACKALYMPDNLKLEDFTELVLKISNQILVTPLYALSSLETCNKCNQTSSVIALGCCNIMKLEDDDEGWQNEEMFVLISDIGYLPANVAEKVMDLSPRFQFVFMEDYGESMWVNTCAFCGAPFDDMDMHCSPGRAFFPLSFKDSKILSLHHIKCDHSFLIVGSTGYYGLVEDIFDVLNK